MKSCSSSEGVYFLFDLTKIIKNYGNDFMSRDSFLVDFKDLITKYYNVTTHDKLIPVSGQLIVSKKKRKTRLLTNYKKD